MRRTFFGLLLLSAGCIAGSASVQRDDRILRELSRQERWAQAALDAKPAADQLESIRAGDYGSVGAARKELQKLIQAVDRGTWIRDGVAELIKEDPDPQLAQQFDRAGRLRADALHAGDELALALAETKGGLALADLRPAFEAMRKANASEDRLAKRPISPAASKLAPAPLPSPKPFIEAAARLVSLNEELVKELDRLTPEEQTQIRARLADLEREGEDQKKSAPPAAAAPGSPAPPEPAVEAQAPSNTLQIAGDAAGLIAKKAPHAITLREDGLFALSYDDGDYLVDPDGKLVRKEQPPGTAAPEAAAPPDTKAAPKAPAKKKK